jgi:hypothetical protein
VPFHVEIRSGYQHARAFNLGPDELREQVLLPWLDDRRIELGDQVWRPGDSRLTVLEGPALEGPDLAFGQGWQNAQKRSGNVTDAALEAVRASAAPASAAAPPAQVTVLAATSPAAHDARDRLVAELRFEHIDWSAARARLLARAAVVAPAPTDGLAVLAILDGAPGAELAFDLGLALGALGGRVVIVAADGAADLASALQGVPIIDASATDAIAERLRLAR